MVKFYAMMVIRGAKKLERYTVLQGSQTMSVLAGICSLLERYTVLQGSQTITSASRTAVTLERYTVLQGSQTSNVVLAEPRQYRKPREYIGLDLL